MDRNNEGRIILHNFTSMLETLLENPSSYLKICGTKTCFHKATRSTSCQLSRLELCLKHCFCPCWVLLEWWWFGGLFFWLNGEVGGKEVK